MQNAVVIQSTFDELRHLTNVSFMKTPQVTTLINQSLTRSSALNRCKCVNVCQ